MLSFGIQGGVFRYWAVIALQAVYRSQRNAKLREQEAFELRVQASELARQLATAQLSTLKMQLQPHFLFNTLGAIMVLIQQQNTVQAEAMVARLGDLLRLTLEDVEAQEVPLWRELEFLRLYLAIEQVRFEDRLRVRIAPAPELDDVLVPHMVLQPVVENAVRHGLGQSEEAVTIEVAAMSVHGSLMLVVLDDGPGLVPGDAWSLWNRAGEHPGTPGAPVPATPRISSSSRRGKSRGSRHHHAADADGPERRDRHVEHRAMKVRVLVVDDEPLAREGLKLLLGRQPGGRLYLGST